MLLLRGFKSFTLFIKRGDMGISFNERKEEKGMKERVDKGKANSIALDIRKPLAEVPHSVGNIKGNINREVKT